MIITCPDCNRRYLVDKTLMHSTQRKLRCRGCAHTWLHEPSRPPLMAEPMAPTSTAVAKPHARSVWGWMVYSLVILLIGTSFLTQREWIVYQWPSLERIYDHLGLKIEHVGLGLVVQNVHAAYRQGNSETSIVVRGDLINSSDETKLMPGLKVFVSATKTISKWDLWRYKIKNFFTQSKEPALVYEAVYRPAQKRLMPHETLAFEVEIHPFTRKPIQELQGAVTFVP